MIGWLKGILIEKNPENITIDVSGVGYELEVPASTLCQLPELQQDVILNVFTHVREDAIRLFGFENSFDKKVFQDLISVSGVGPKAALALLGPVDGVEICEIITSGNVARLTAIPGIGPKTAERLILELKSKLQKSLARNKDNIEISTAQKIKNIEGAVAANSKSTNQIQKRILQKQLIEDLKSALSNLGYKDKQYSEVVLGFEKRLNEGESISLESALKESLTKLSERIVQRI